MLKGSKSNQPNMWKFEWTKKSEKEFLSLDSKTRNRIIDAVNDKLLKHPDYYLVPLTGDKSGFFKFRVGDYRLICSKRDDKLVVTVLRVKHRREVYE